MKKVRLKAGLSYVAMNFSCVRGSPVCVEDGIAAKLMKTGRFEIADTEPVEPEFESPAGKHVSITSMKKDELLAFAEAHDIDIGDCKNNDERVRRIQNEIGLNGFAQMIVEERGDEV